MLESSLFQLTEVIVVGFTVTYFQNQIGKTLFNAVPPGVSVVVSLSFLSLYTVFFPIL